MMDFVAISTAIQSGIASLIQYLSQLYIVYIMKRLSVDLPPAFPSCTVLLPESPFAMIDTDTHHAKIQGHRSNSSVVGVQTHTHTQTAPIQ